MISYAPLWETMKRKNATTYTLQVKGEISNIRPFSEYLFFAIINPP